MSMRKIGLMSCLVASLAVLACSEKSKKQDPNGSAANVEEAPSKKITKKVIPQLRAVFSILSKVMIIAERANGSTEGTRSAIGVLEDLSSETAIGKVDKLADGRTQVEVSLVFGIVLAEKKADISIILTGIESADAFDIKTVEVKIHDLEGSAAGTEMVYGIVSEDQSKSGATLHRFEMTQMEALSVHLNRLNPKIRRCEMNGDLQVAIGRKELLVSSSGLKWSDKIMKYEVSELNLTAEVGDGTPIKELKVNAVAESTNPEKPLFVSLKLNSKNVTFADFDKGFVVEKRAANPVQ